LDPIAEIEARLARHPDVLRRRDPGWLVIASRDADGFDVSLARDGDQWIVGIGADGVHEHFDDPRKALDFVTFALSDRCRVRWTSWFGLFVRIVVEAADGAGWRRIANTGTLTFAPHWRWRRDVVRRNALFAVAGQPS
jgi:hypothetical protein